MPWSTLDCIVVHWIGCYKMIYLISFVDILTFFFCFIIHWFPRLVCKDPRELGFHTNLLFSSLVRCLVLHLFLTLSLKRNFLFAICAYFTDLVLCIADFCRGTGIWGQWWIIKIIIIIIILHDRKKRASKDLVVNILLIGYNLPIYFYTRVYNRLL